MGTVLAFLQGKKSYLIALGLGIVAALKYLGKVSPQLEEAVVLLLNGGGLVALRLALSNSNQPSVSAKKKK